MATDQSYQSVVENREDAVICVSYTQNSACCTKKSPFGNPNHPNAALNLKWKKNNSDCHITKSVRFWTLIRCSFILTFSWKHKKQNKKPKSDQDQEGKGKEAQSMAELNQGLSSSEETENTLEAEEISLSYHTPWDNYDTAENKFFLSPAILPVCLLRHKTAHWLLIPESWLKDNGWLSSSSRMKKKIKRMWLRIQDVNVKTSPHGYW